MLKRLVKQYKTPWIGGFKETLSQVAFWVSMINFAMIGATFYYTTMRFVWPQLSLYMFIIAIVLLVVIGLIIEYKFIVPSIWAFRGKQMFEHESEVTNKLNEVLEKLSKLEGKDESSVNSSNETVE